MPLAFDQNLYTTYNIRLQDVIKMSKSESSAASCVEHELPFRFMDTKTHKLMCFQCKEDQAATGLIRCIKLD